MCVWEVGGGCVCVRWEECVRVRWEEGMCGSACERQVRALKGNILYTIYVLLIDCQAIVQSW